MTRNIAIVHFNTPEMTEACIMSIRKHGGEDYKVFIFDNSDARPFTKKMKGVRVFNNRQGQIIDFKAELAKFPNKSEEAGCAKGCWFGSDVHMMSVQKLWELVPEGFVLLDSDVLLKRNIEFMFLPDYCSYGYISISSGYRHQPRLVPMVLWINVPMCVAGGARFYDPDRSWALHDYYSEKNWWDTGAAFLDDIKRLKPQCKGRALSKAEIDSTIAHFGGGSWRQNDIKTQQRWLKEHEDLWKPNDIQS